MSGFIEKAFTGGSQGYVFSMNPGMYHLNVHTTKYADGAVRGQLVASK